MDGDVDVSQRKGKVITLFDVKLVLDFEGKEIVESSCPLIDPTAGSTAEEEDASGTITIPEVAHDTTEDEYVVRSIRCPPLVWDSF